MRTSLSSLRWPLTLLLSLAACGDPPASPADMSEPSAPQSLSIGWGPVEVAPGEEDTRCVVKRLGNTEALRIGKIRNELGLISHHMIVYRVEDTAERLEPFPCTPFTDTLNPAKGAPLMITQKNDETLTLPEGVAFVLHANQMVRIELHYLNSGTTPKMVSTKTTFTSVPEAGFKHEADLLFIGNPDIDIPPMSNATVGPTYFPLPAALAGINFFGITGHTHHWGTNVTIATAPAEAGPYSAVYDLPEWSWDEPATVYASPPFTVPPGGGFRFTCSYNNTSNTRARFGESTGDEMCFFWAYYYPSKGAYTCIHTAQGGGQTGCCPGHPICSLL